MPDALILLVIPVAVALFFAFKWWRNRIPDGWVIGPIINGKNYSKGLPLRPEPTAGGWRLVVPERGEPHYITRNGTVRGRIAIRYRVTGTFRAVEGGNPSLSLHFQCKGDNWSAKGEHESRRWYSLAEFPLVEGEHTATAELVPEQWVSVMGQSGPAEFAAALTSIARVGVVMGGPNGRGHGVRGPGTVEVDWL